MPRLDSPLKWHGGKSPSAARIVELMPDHLHDVEPFAGGLSVLLAKSPASVSEVVNDLDGGLVNFWRVLKDEATFPRFVRLAQATPFSEREWHDADDRLDDTDPVARAAAFFVRCRQSLAGRRDTFTPITRLRRGMNEQASAWLSAVEGLSAVHARLARAIILCRPAVEIIRSQDGPRTLFYLDPPDVHSTRASTASVR